ncbi:precorrin-6y C5,15-methyltransferase (decarboxylating) subunit CbiE [Ancylobacter dichloromethanicus]|uniref:Precorrin-6Y methyltransferase n=1 Tax=Ancylobacter dichloromethanicus TaxID=518825 RepID=A0A9W6N050_9HYPH|nr:precorrin-6y C5,15-methyltransferase (decarboxylating) subunit CbiE [Ancylobacter dichloromethanicus]MBS7553597.1 precorrin-6y C5,15-methyltransferase (decarboxylating) subunit CbiE [Ancylobacter dichloromethanicus]GLK72657.1 precorrin-6Y methyltransferase [Ancylobacter dichloromethanicus]
MQGSETIAPQPSTDEPNVPGDGRWLSIVGIGEDGLAGLSPAARAAVEAAECVFGGARHLALAGAAVRGGAHPWPSPFARGIEEVLARRGRPVCVLASGDPFLHGVGATLARHVPAAEMLVFPAPSAFSLACARLGWPLAEVTCLTVHGRSLDLVRAHLHPGRRLLLLTSDGAGPGEIAARLAGSGFGHSRLTVLEALGGPRERLRTARAEGFALDGIDPLNLLAIEVAAGEGARLLARAPGLPDELFEHDGQLTKREIRAVTLSALGPRRGELLWDIGAGAGSVGIEWMLADPSLTAIGIEERPERAARARRNAGALGVPGLEIVEGRAPEALAGLPTPDAIFIGGGASEPGVLDVALNALKPGGRLVVNAVTLETEALLIARHGALGGELVRLSVARAMPVGGLTGWRPAMPVTQWSWSKPGGAS